MMSPEEFAAKYAKRETDEEAPKVVPCPGVTPLRDPFIVAPQPSRRVSARPYNRTEGHDRLQAKFALLSARDLKRLCDVCGLDVTWFSDMVPRIVLEKPVAVDRYSRANDWRMDAVIESEGLHVILEVKTTIDSMGELLGQCQRYMRHYRPDHLEEGQFCPVIVACPVIEPWIIEVLEAQGFYWLANERWDEFFGGASYAH